MPGGAQAGQVGAGRRVAHVLVVEDEGDIAALITHTLERTGDMQASIVGSGDAALRAVAEGAPDVVILDLNLPVLSGSEVCRILQSRPAAAQLPIIMLTAGTTESDRVSGLVLGADDYVTKPFSLRELGARVRAAHRSKPSWASATASQTEGAANEPRRSLPAALLDVRDPPAAARRGAGRVRSDLSGRVQVESTA